jgi:putative DNA primase/helicase
MQTLAKRPAQVKPLELQKAALTARKLGRTAVPLCEDGTIAGAALTPSQSIAAWTEAFAEGAALAVECANEREASCQETFTIDGGPKLWLQFGATYEEDGAPHNHFPLKRVATLATLATLDAGNGQVSPVSPATFEALATLDSSFPAAAVGQNGPMSPVSPVSPSPAGIPQICANWPEPLPLVCKLDAKPYPVDALPEIVRNAVTEVRDYLQSPVALIAMSALAAASTAVQGLADVRRDARLCGPSALYLTAVAQSGERKSSADGFFSKAISDFELERGREMASEVRASQAAHDGWAERMDGVKAAIKTLARKGGDATERQVDLDALSKAEPKLVRVPSIFHTDDSVESLAFDLANKWPSGAIISSEAGIVLGGHAFGTESILRGLAAKNIFWDGSSYRVSRRTSENFTVRGVRLTIFMQLQPEALMSFYAKSGSLTRGVGFWARHLLAWPQTTQGTRNYVAPGPMPALDTFSKRIGDLLRLPMAVDDDGALTPPALEMDAEASNAWICAHDEIEAALAPNGDCADIRDVASKAGDNIARLAAIFHVLEHGVSGDINTNAINAAAEVVVWHLHEARRFFGQLSTTPTLNAAEVLQSFIASHGGTVTSREISRNGPHSLRGGEWEAALTALISTHRARKKPNGRQGFTVELNPQILDGSRDA